MANVKILFDPIANTMNIWWGKPSTAHTAIEVDDPKRNDVIVMDKNGKPISIEIIGVFPKELNVSTITQALGVDKTEPFLLTN